MQPSHEPLDLVPVLEDGLPMGVPLMAALGLQSLLQGAGIEAQLSGFRAEPVLVVMALPAAPNELADFMARNLDVLFQGTAHAAVLFAIDGRP